MINYIRGFFGNSVIQDFRLVAESLEKGTTLPEAMETIKPIKQKPTIKKIVIPEQATAEIKELINKHVGDLKQLEAETIASYNKEALTVNNVLSVFGKTDEQMFEYLEEIVSINKYDDTGLLEIILYKSDFSEKTWNDIYSFDILPKSVKDLKGESKLNFTPVSSKLNTGGDAFQKTVNKLYSMINGKQLTDIEKERLSYVLVVFNKNKALKYFSEPSKPIITEATVYSDFIVPVLKSMETEFYQSYNNLLISKQVLENINPIFTKTMDITKQQVEKLALVTNKVEAINAENALIAKEMETLEKSKASLKTQVNELKRKGTAKEIEIAQINKALEKNELDLKNANDLYEKNKLILEQQVKTTEAELLLKNKEIADTVKKYETEYIKIAKEKNIIESDLAKAQESIKSTTSDVSKAQEEIDKLKADLKIKIDEQETISGKIKLFLEGTKEYILSQKVLTFGSISSFLIGIGGIVGIIYKEIVDHKSTKKAIVKKLHDKTGMNKDLLDKLFDKTKHYIDSKTRTKDKPREITPKKHKKHKKKK